MPQEVSANFGWGLLVISDRNSKDEIGEFASPTDRFLASSDAVVIRILHGQEGDVAVRVCSSRAERVGHGTPHHIAAVSIRVESGKLIIGNVLREAALTVDVPPGILEMDIYTNHLVDPDVVEIVYKAGTLSAIT
jgi:hypothetical protein